MSQSEAPVKSAQQSEKFTSGSGAKPLQVSPDQFYRKITARPEIRELLKRLAER